MILRDLLFFARSPRLPDFHSAVIKVLLDLRSTQKIGLRRGIDPAMRGAGRSAPKTAGCAEREKSGDKIARSSLDFLLHKDHTDVAAGISIRRRLIYLIGAHYDDDHSG